MCSPSVPAPPDPVRTAAAQTGTNVSTAVANANLNNINQVTPDGSLTFDQTGSSSFTDPVSGETFDIPNFTATTQLSDVQQGIKDLGDQTKTNLGQIGVEQSDRIRELLGTPIDLSNEATESRLFELGSNRLNPLFEEREEDLRARLANQGVQPGSAAFDREFANFSQSRNDAFNELLLGGRAQAVNEIIEERNRPLNEIASLTSQSQIASPNFVNTQRSEIPTTDFAGIQANNYNQQLRAAAQNNAFQQQLVGGLFGLGSSAILA